MTGIGVHRKALEVTLAVECYGNRVSWWSPSSRAWWHVGRAQEKKGEWHRLGLDLQ